MKNLEQKRKEEKVNKKKYNKEREVRKEQNIIYGEVEKSKKINNWMETKEYKEWIVAQKAEERKK